MNEYSRRWGFWGLAGAVLWPVLLLAADALLHRRFAGHSFQPYFDALAFAFAGSVGAIAVPALPVRPWLRLALFFLYTPLFLCAVYFFAPWVW